MRPHRAFLQFDEYRAVGEDARYEGVSSRRASQWSVLRFLREQLSVQGPIMRKGVRLTKEGKRLFRTVRVEEAVRLDIEDRQ